MQCFLISSDQDCSDMEVKQRLQLDFLNLLLHSSFPLLYPLVAIANV